MICSPSARPSASTTLTLGAQFTPTVSVLDAEGRALGEAIIGMRLPDFYGQYVDNAIDHARAALAGRP